MPSLRATVSACLLWAASAASAAAPPAEIPEALRGGWRDRSGSVSVNVEKDRILLWQNQELTVRGLIRQEPGTLVLRWQGAKEIWSARVEDGRLHLGTRGIERIYERLSPIPLEARLDPLPLGPAGPLPPERARRIAQEIGEHYARDQEVRTNLAQALNRWNVDKQNEIWLVDLIARVGWIDAARFGPEAAGQALTLVNHFDNLRLSLTALPLARKDAVRGGQAFAVLYDALQLKLGRRQRYGTQMATDAHGATYVLPLEDPAQVDQALREIGAPPLARTLADFRDAAAPGQALPRIAREEEEDPGRLP
jgi:hypothetical protein